MKMKILIAEDDPIPRRLLEASLVMWDYEVVIAKDGDEAWEILQSKDSPTLAIFDWLMPGLDGLELCRRIRARTDSPYVYVILLTSRGSKEDVVAGMEAGADDYLTKPFNRHELQVRLRAGRRILDLQSELLKSLFEVQKAEEAVAAARLREVETGAKIQQTLLLGQPPENFPGCRIAALTIPSQHVDGDFYDFFAHGARCIDVVVGDVMGKGVSAALLGAAIKSQTMRAMSQLLASDDTPGVPEPETIVGVVHGEVTEQFIGLESFATLCYARFNVQAGNVTYVDCGHTKTVVYRAAQDICETLIGGDNMPLGFSKREVYKQTVAPLAPGDLFLFYSDGVTEAEGKDNEQYGSQRLLEFVKANHALDPKTLVERVREEVTAWTGSHTHADDLTCVAVLITSEGGKDLHAEVEVTSALTQLEPIRSFLRRFSEQLQPPLDEVRLATLELAANEAASNIMRHAYIGAQDRSIRVEMDADGDRVILQLHHWGKSFDPTTAPPPTFDGTREGGFGVYMIAECVDEVRYLTDSQ
ncbi:MAG: SpoIIE family protein phosphatase, partial [Armatimonadota bacterium]|nr:SpoIIE family protein phosphatase [Armatimonadota bacterium]